MKRGSIVSTADRGDVSANPRLRLVIQADTFNAFHPTVTVCPITRHASGDVYYRVPVLRSEENGLLFDGEIEIDLIQAIRRQRIGSVIGTASEETMFNVDQTLRRWLAL